MNNGAEMKDSSSPATRRRTGFREAVSDFFRHPFGYFLLPLITVSIVIVVPLLYSGFCITQLRYLSDDEFIAAAIDDVLQSIPIVETPSGGYAQFAPKKRVRYRDLSEFHQWNPSCCEFVPHDLTRVNLWHQMCGKAAASVSVRYKVRHVGENGAEQLTEAVAQRIIGNCGTVLNVGY